MEARNSFYQTNLVLRQFLRMPKETEHVRSYFGADNAVRALLAHILFFDNLRVSGPPPWQLPVCLEDQDHSRR